MTQYKLIALDLDDTLLNSHLDVSVKNREAILKAKKQGVEVTLATGRMYRSALPIARKLQIDIPLITYQGALIKDPRNDEVIINRPVPMDYAMEIIERGYQLGYHTNVYLDDNLYIDKVTDEAISYANIAKVPLNPVGDLRKYLKEEPTKILFIANKELLDVFYQELTEIYPHLHITKSKKFFLEVMHPLAAKGHALKYLSESMGIAREEVIAIGDSYNDVDMLRFAGLGVAMGNAWDDIKKAADYVTDTHNHDGVAKVIDKFVFGLDV